MINWLKGTVKFKDAAESAVTLDVNGVGYLVYVLEAELENMAVGQTTDLFINLYQRETGVELYGFASQEERDFFIQLNDVTGVGPKSALGVLKQASPSEIKRAIIHGDPGLLTKVSGIGKKTAERIILELKSKIADAEVAGEHDFSAVASAASAVDAMVKLGYTKAEARDALRAVPSEVVSAKEKVRQALKSLGAPR